MESGELVLLFDALQKQRDRIDGLKSLNSDSPQYKAWRTKTMELVRRADISQFTEDFDDLLYPKGGFAILGESKHERLARERPYYLERLETARAQLTALMETLDELGPGPQKREVYVEEKKPEGAPAPTLNVNVVTQIVNQLAVQSSFALLVDEVKALPLTDEERAEGAKMLEELEQEIHSASPKWDRIRTIIKWLIDHAWEVFIKVIPYLLEAYGKSRGVT